MLYKFVAGSLNHYGIQGVFRLYYSLCIMSIPVNVTCFDSK